MRQLTQANRSRNAERAGRARRAGLLRGDGRGAPATRLATVLVLALGLLALAASSAFAAETRVPTGLAFGPEGVGHSGAFAGLKSIAIDQASGDVYAYVGSNGAIYKFDAAGNPVNFAKTGNNTIFGAGGRFSGNNEYQLAVAPPGAPGGTAGDIYLANNGQSLEVFSPEGEKLESLALNRENCGVAINSAGHLFTGNFGDQILEFTPSANPPVEGDKSGETNGVLSSTCNIAVGPGAIYGFRYFGGAQKLSSLADTTAEEIDSSASTGAVDPVDGTLYADRRTSVRQYDAAGKLVLSFANGISNSLGIAVRHSTDRVYVADNERIVVYGSPVTVPDVTTEAPTGATGTSVTLNGTVNPSNIALTKCAFQYGHGEELKSSIPCEQAVPTDGNDHKVSAHLTGLPQSEGFNYRLVAANANGENQGSPEFAATRQVARTEEATGVAGSVATLNGTVLPGGEAVTACFFQYGKTEALGSTVPCAQTVPTDEGEHAVSAAISGLEFGAKRYFFRLVVEQGGEEVRGSTSFLTTPGPEIIFARTAGVGAEEANVEAKVRPRGEELEFFIEYGTTSSYDQATENVSIGGGEEEETVVSETLRDLAPATTYHWRVVFVSANGSVPGPDRAFVTRSPSSGPETGCPNQSFRTGPSANLPDCRAYEQVSPVSKNGTNVQHDVNIVRASSDGNRLTFASNTGLPAAGGGSSLNFAAVRGDQGWTTYGLVPAVSPADSQNVVLAAFDENVSVTVNAGRTGLYVGNIGESNYPLHEIGIETQPEIGDFADDANVFTFETTKAVVPGAVAGAPNDYLYDHGAVSLVGRIPAGSATSCDDSIGPACVPASGGAYIGAYDWQKSGNPSGFGGARGGYYPEDTTSNDGSKVIFTAVGSGQIYVRENDTSTTQVSASQRATPDPNGTKPASYMGATADGSKIYFGSCEKLTEDSTAVSTEAGSCTENTNQFGGEFLQGQDLYEYDTATGELVDLTVDHDSSDPLSAAVLGFVGASADGSDVYFAANGALGTSAEPGTCNLYYQGSGQCNLYLAHAGQVTFVARLEGNYDSADWAVSNGNNGSNRWKTARVSANGAVLFASKESLTGYANANCPAGFGDLAPCAEIYRYAPGEAGPKCLSCNPTGAAPTGDAELESNGEAFGSTIDTLLLTRNLSSNGNRAFFNTPDQLVAADQNQVSDVYEWEAVGSGSCKSAQVANGCLYLLSDGSSSSPSFFGDASPSGGNAFFFTDDPLVPQDKDALVDAYDARAEGGLAEQHAAEAAAPCSGEACKGPGTVAPSESSPGSSTFAGPTNQKEAVKPQCKKKKGKNGCKKSKKKKKHKEKGQGHKSSGKSHGNRGGSK